MCSFFFSSRRRHTRLQGDWSSDVCSSDLLADDVVGGAADFDAIPAIAQGLLVGAGGCGPFRVRADLVASQLVAANAGDQDAVEDVARRSEERRVGKEGRSRRAAEPRSDNE